MKNSALLHNWSIAAILVQTGKNHVGLSRDRSSSKTQCEPGKDTVSYLSACRANSSTACSLAGLLVQPTCLHLSLESWKILTAKAGPSPRPISWRCRGSFLSC